MFKKIVCPIDFSECSRQAFQYAKAMADTFESRLVLIHVAPDITAAYSDLLPEYPAFGSRQEDLAGHFDEFTRDWSGDLQKVVRNGTAHTEILTYAKREKADLIVIGARGLSRIERLFLGSTAEMVARKSPCPVLTVHPKPMGLPIKKILLPVDFSPFSFAILPTVARLAESFRAEINLLHVVEMGEMIYTGLQAKEYEYFAEVKQRLAREWGLPQEHTVKEKLKFVSPHVGSAGYGILEFAQDWDVDLIAMATHGRSGLSKMLMGSVAEKVVRIAPCPVLSVRSRGYEQNHIGCTSPGAYTRPKDKSHV